jgi:CRP-like cAMP-binding protein
MTVRCKTDVHAAIIDYDRFKEMYFQNPQFGSVCIFDRRSLATSRELPRTAGRPEPKYQSEHDMGGRTWATSRGGRS